MFFILQKPQFDNSHNIVHLVISLLRCCYPRIRVFHAGHFYTFKRHFFFLNVYELDIVVTHSQAIVTHNHILIGPQCFNRLLLTFTNWKKSQK